MKKKNIEINGKIKIQTLDQIWGEDGSSKYKTLDEEVYLSQLSEMNKSDLHAHSIRLGVMPVDNRQRLTNNLLREFRTHVGSYAQVDSAQKSKTIVSDEVRKILNEGR